MIINALEFEIESFISNVLGNQKNKKIMKMNILPALLFVLVGCENNAKPFWLSGSWKGTFKNTHTTTDAKTHFVDQPAYPTELFYKVSTNSGTVTYPTLGCTSNWVLVKTDNDTLFFEEKIKNDKNNVGCVDKIQYKLLQVSKNEIAITGTGKTASGHSIAINGVLAKVEYTRNVSAKSDAFNQEKNVYQNTSHNAENKTSSYESNAILKSDVVVQAKDKPQNVPNVITPTTKKTENKNNIVGIWEGMKYTYDYGIKSWIGIVWEVKANQTSRYTTKDKYGNITKGEYKWQMTGNTYYEFASGEWVPMYKINWDNNNYQGLTIECNCLLNNIHFNRTNKVYVIEEDEPIKYKTTCVSCHGKKNKTCHYCNGIGKVEYTVQREKWNNITERHELYTEIETQICQACKNGQITCNVCAGKGGY